MGNFPMVQMSYGTSAYFPNGYSPAKLGLSHTGRGFLFEALSVNKT